VRVPVSVGIAAAGINLSIGWWTGTEWNKDDGVSIKLGSIRVPSSRPLLMAVLRSYGLSVPVWAPPAQHHVPCITSKLKWLQLVLIQPIILWQFDYTSDGQSIGILSREIHCHLCLEKYIGISSVETWMTK
jgi:hypothetical protein